MSQGPCDDLAELGQEPRPDEEVSSERDGPDGALLVGRRCARAWPWGRFRAQHQRVPLGFPESGAARVRGGFRLWLPL